MSVRNDTLTKMRDRADRVHYATGVLLDAADFGAEQNYHRGRLARALDYLHGSGTVAGLKVEWEEVPGGVSPAEREDRLIVQPGMAIDRLGRMIEVPAAACLRLARWYRQQDADALQQALHSAPFPGVDIPDDVTVPTGVIIDLFLHFVVCERGKTPAFAAGPFDALNAVVPSRLRDSYELELVVRPEPDPPLPENPWPDLRLLPEGEDSAEQGRRALQNAILSAWREDTDQADLGGLNPLPEHVLGQNPMDVFLARLVIPAAASAGDNEPPAPTSTAVQVGNHSRSFVYPAGAQVRMWEWLTSLD